MRKPRVALGLFLAELMVVAQGRTQTPADSARNSASAPTADIISAQLERSFISPGKIGVRMNVGNLDSLVFEGDLSPHFALRSPHFLPPFLRSVRAIVFTPKVVLRMLTSNSNPVRIPNFNPGILAFIDSPFGDSTQYLLAGISHYSNGAEDEPVVAGHINYKSGNFSTNYVQLGYSRAVLNTGTYFFVQFVPLELHFMQDSLERADFGQWWSRVSFINLGNTTKRSEAERLGFNQSVTQLDISSVWNAPGRRSWRRFNASFMFAWLPPITGDLGLFMSAYWGQDYYNIRYEKRNLSLLRWGIVANGASYRFPGDRGH